MRLAQVAVFLAGCGRVGFGVLDDAPPDTCTTCKPELVARWPLGSDARDLVGGHDGVPHAATFTGSAADLAGGYIQIDGLDLAAEAPAAFTIALWVDLGTSTMAYSRYFSSFYYDSPTSSRGTILLDVNLGDGFRCAPHIDGDFIYIESVHTVPAGQWHHLACTWDGAMIRQYVDALETGSGVVDGTFNSTAALPVVIGASVDENGTPENAATMLVRDVRVYRRALSPAELAVLATP